MGDVARHLERWVRAGLLDAEAAGRIAAYEGSPDRAPDEDASGRPTATEAFLYLGMIVLIIGVFALAATNWDDLERWARVAIVGVPTGLALVAGLGMRLFDEQPIRRGGQVAWFSAVALAGGLALIVGDEYGPGVDDPAPRLVAGAVAVGVAGLLWALSPAHLQVLALGGAAFFLAQMVGAWPDSFDQQAAGLVSLGTGVGLLAVAERGLFAPRPSGRLVAAALVVAGAFEMQVFASWYWEPWTIVAGAALVALSLRRETFIYIAMGMLGIFAGLMTIVGEHLSDQIGGPMAFIVSGVLIVAGVLILVQVRRSLRWGKP